MSKIGLMDLRAFYALPNGFDLVQKAVTCCMTVKHLMSYCAMMQVVSVRVKYVIINCAGSKDKVPLTLTID